MDFSNWKTSGQYFSYKSQHSIFYQEAGEGDTLLLLHGFPTASWDWHLLWPDLTKGFHVIAPDFIGFGFSAKPRFYSYSIMDQADMIEILLFKKGIDTVHVLAHDFGDTVAQELLARFSERKKKELDGLEIKSVCLLNGGLFPGSHQPLLIQKLLMSPIGILLTPFLNKQKLRKSFHRIFGKETQPSKQEIDEFYSLITHNNGKYRMHRLIRYMAERRKYRERWQSALQDAVLPLRLIIGADDPISGERMAKRYEELIPNPDVILLEGIGHYPQVEVGERVLGDYLAFVAM